jgi:hypothetical protein
VEAVEHKVVLLKPENLVWSFEQDVPRYIANGHDVKVDAFPAYPHNIALVESILKSVSKKFPIDWPVTLYVLSNEVLERTNAYAQGQAFNYNKKFDEANDHDEWYPREPYIVFSGKRIPILPAMTKYLVPHEYGHIVEDWIAYKQNRRDYDLLKEYAEIRKLEPNPKSYGGGWHLDHGEIFANDFRILICKSTPDFWPHLVPRPEDCPAIVKWWKDAKKLCK